MRARLEAIGATGTAGLDQRSALIHRVDSVTAISAA